MLDVAEQAQAQWASVAQCLRTHVNLRDAGALREELAIGKVCSKHQERVAALHGLVAGSETDQPGHPDVTGVVILEMLLAAQSVYDRRAQLLRELHDLVVGAGTPGAAKQGDVLGAVEQ